MDRVYSRINWENEPSQNTPLNENNLNRMDYALYTIDGRVVEMDVTKANKSEVLDSVRSVDYNTKTGVFTFTYNNGTTFTVDLNIEKIPVSFSMSDKGIITMITADGTEYTADVSSAIPAYTFKDSSVVDFQLTTKEDGSREVTANIVDGSITAEKLQPNYLADVTSQASTSRAKSLEAEGYAVGTQNGAPVSPDSPYYQNNAKYYKDQAQGAAFQQSNWSETDSTKSAFIINKPFQTIGEGLEVVDGALNATGGGGVSDYTQLSNKPSINGKELNGSVSLSDIGAQPSGSYVTTGTKATASTLGLVKPDGTTTTVDADGTLHAKAGTTINELNDIGDVTITSPQNKQALVYENGSWVNEEVQGGGGNDVWEGTTDELEQQASSIPNDTLILTNDDYDGNICQTADECVASDNPSDVAGASALAEVVGNLANREVTDFVLNNKVGATVDSIKIIKSGNVVNVYMRMIPDKTYNPIDNVFTANISKYRPITPSAHGCGFTGRNNMELMITSDGNIIVRHAGYASIGTGNPFTIFASYLTND